jgi:agmatinase
LQRFLAAGEHGGNADAIVQGVAYDEGASWRRGAAQAPAAIREASDSIESFSPVQRRDLTQYALADAGDVDLAGATGGGMVAAVAAATERLARTGALVVTLGGDHSISMGTSQGLRAVHEDLAHIVLDAHLDMRPDYEGNPYSHACGTRHMAMAGPTVALGIRSGSREEFDDAEHMLVGISDGLSLTDRMRAGIDGRLVFVSLDLDVLDPSIFPGTGNPEPGGATYQQVRDALLALEGERIVGLDLVECAPRLDPSGVSAIVAAELAREGILTALAHRLR